jgi:hypothetical protein
LESVVNVTENDGREDWLDRSIRPFKEAFELGHVQAHFFWEESTRCRPFKGKNPNFKEKTFESFMRRNFGYTATRMRHLQALRRSSRWF